MPTENTTAPHEEPDTTHPIQVLLNRSYSNTFANRGRRGESAPIRVDDLKETDVGWLLPRLTIVTADHDKEEFTLEIDDAILTALDEGQLSSHGGQVKQNGRHTSYRFHLCLSELDAIRDLATAIEAVTAKGQSYSDKNLRWICPRTADALHRLADELVELAPDAADDAFSDLYDL